jgi:hypothetical protein
VDQGREITLKGIQSSTQLLQEVKSEQVLKWAQGNDLWALAVVEAVQILQEEDSRVEIQNLLKEFQDVFEQPTTLPPHRFYDHQIPLLPNSTHVNARPYKYSPQHKR